MEKDLFLPIKAYFEAYGYTCDGEVQDIDLYMEKGDESVAVELKQELDFKAVQQAALRQKLTDTVYIGIFKPKDMGRRAFQDKLYLLKRLGIGLIVVSRRKPWKSSVSPWSASCPFISSTIRERKKGFPLNFKRGKPKTIPAVFMPPS